MFARGPECQGRQNLLMARIAALLGEPVLLGGLNQRQRSSGGISNMCRGGIGAPRRGSYKQQNSRTLRMGVIVY